METTGMVPNTQQPSQSNPHGSPTTMSGGRIDSGLTPRTHISEPEPLEKPTDNGRSFPLPERGMHFSRKFSIADALDRRHSSTSSFNRQEEQQLKASEDLEVGGTSGARSSSCESTTVTERDHALNIGKSSRRTEPAESAGKMAQEASAQDVKLVNSTETADRAIPDGRVYTVGTADRDDGVHPEYLPSSVKSSEVTGSSSENPRNKDELHMQRFDSQLTRKAGAGFVLEASSLDTASSSVSSRDDRSLKSRSTSEGTPMPGTNSDIWTRKSGAPNSNGLDPTSKTAAPGATSNSSTLSPMLDLSASDLELLKDKPRYHPTGVTKRKASVNKRFPYFTTDSVEFKEEISKGYDGNAVMFPSKDYDVKVEKKGRVKVNNEEHLKRVTTDGKYGQCQVQCKLSDSNVEVVQTERKNIHEHVDSNAGSEGREIGKNACLIRRKYSPTKIKTERDTGSDDKKLSGKTRTKKGRDPSSKKGRRTKRMTADAPSLIAGNEPTHTKETMELERRPFEASPLANDYCDASVASLPRDTGAHQEARGFQDVALDGKKEPSVPGKSPTSLRAESLDSVKELCELRHGLCNENAIQIPLPSQLLDSPKTEAPTAAPPMKCEREREGTESVKKKTHLKSSKSSSSSTKSARRNSCKASKGSRKRKKIITDATSQISGNQSTDTKETMQQEKMPFEASPFAIYHCEASIAPLPPDTGAHQEASGFQDVALDVEREPTFTAKSSPSSMAESLDSVIKESRELHHGLRNKNAVQLPPHLVESPKPEAPQALSATKCECDIEDAKSVKKKTAKKSSKSSSSSTKSGGRNSCKASKGSRKATKTTSPTEVQIEKGGSEVGGMLQACPPNDPKKAKVGEITPDNKKLRAEDDSKMALLRRPPSIDDAQAVQPFEVKEPTKSEIDKQRKHKGVFEGAIVLQVPPVEDALEQTRPKPADAFEKAVAPNVLHLPTTKGPPAYIAPGTVQSASSSFSHTSGIMNRGLTGSGTGVSFEIGISKPNKDDSKITVEKATVALTPSDKACTSARLRRRPTILKTSGAMLAATRSVRHHSAVDFGTTRFTVISPEHKLSRGWSHPLARERTSASTLSSTWDVNTEKPRRSSLSHIMRRRGSSAFEESFSRSTFRPYTTGSQTTYGPNMSTKRVRKDVHTAFLLGPSLVATLGGMCNFFHVGAREGALKHVSITKDRTNLLATGITWVIVTLPAVFTVAATCSAVVWLLYVKPHEPQPLSSLNERVMSAAEARKAQQTTPRGAYYACTAYAVIFAIAYAPSLLLGVEPRIALLGALVWLVLVTSILTPLLRVTFDFVRSIWQQLPWGVVLFLGATQVASCLLQEYKLVNKLFKLMPDSFWERQSSPGVQALLALFTTVMAEIMDKRALTEVMAPILRHVAEVKGVYPAYFAVPVIMGASSNVVMPASVHLALLHELARVPFWILLLLGLILKLILVSLAIATVHIADKAGFLAPPTLPE